MCVLHRIRSLQGSGPNCLPVRGDHLPKDVRGVRVYCDGKPSGCVSDNQLFIEITDPGREFMPDSKTAPPYEGAKPCFLIEEPDDTEFLRDLVTITCAALPAPKPGGERNRRTGE